MANPPGRPAAEASDSDRSDAPKQSPVDTKAGAPPAARRRGTADSKTRAALVDATAQLMLDEGHGAVTARRVAAKVGVNPGLVHYYFHNMDELFLAVFRQGAEANLRRQKRALSSRHPLRSIWKINTDPSDVNLLMQFIVLAQDRSVIKKEIAAYAEQFREVEKKAVAQVQEELGADAGPISPAAASVLLDGIARIIAMEVDLGVTTGHADVIALVDEYLRRFER
ncbi:TetR family transcriptional regulator [Pseudofrankia sp. BMG5.36]|nr:TetR/AcrR family transcriptional regulator [Pseudofrankia sp. BMG5.36]OHV69599.1 TetR family transcriptional regulator [Pseudofrankia sp. BMG5.36]